MGRDPRNPYEDKRNDDQGGRNGWGDRSQTGDRIKDNGNRVTDWDPPPRPAKDKDSDKA
jgi:hypothetical protein